jgi:hypothetical protein
MKQLLRIYVLVIAACCVFALFPRQISAQQSEVNFQVFYDQLGPYGQWVEYSNYGYVWIPSVNSDFVPYLTNGYWVMTEFGWTWASDYEWGWAAFHYGRWDYDDYYGWFWVPDNEWGPSWVTWRQSEGYYGWAPMRPGVTLTLSFGTFNSVPYDRWIFVRDRDIERHDIGRKHINRRDNSRIFNKSSVIAKTFYDDKRHSTYITGPGREDVRQFTGKEIKPFVVREKDRPGQNLANGQLQIYRPQIRKDGGGNKPAPAKLVNLNDVKRMPGRDQEKQPQSDKTGKEQQRPPVNTRNEINNKANPPHRQNVNPPPNEINKVRQPAVSPANKIENKNQLPQQQKIAPRIDKKERIPINQKANVDPSKRERNTNQSTQVKNPNPPVDNRIRNNFPAQQQKLNPPKKENRVEGPTRPQNTNMPKKNVGIIEKAPKAQPVQLQKKNIVDKQIKANAKEEKKKIDDKRPY